MAGEALEIEGLRVAYRVRGRRNEVVRGVDLALPAGEIVALVGESGSGKSTVSQSVIRQLPLNGDVLAGAIRLDGVDLLRLRERALRGIRGARIGFVPQDPGSSLNPLMRVGEQIAEVLRQHQRVSRAQAAARAIEILDEVGIPDPERRARQFPHQLSGGQRQRVLIGIAWACSPQLVVADEPTSALDATVQKQVLDKLQQLVAEQSTTVLLVTHDLAVAADRAQRIAVMQRGVIVEHGPAHEVLGNPTHEYTRQLVAAAPGLGTERLTPRSVAEADRPQILVGRFREENERRGERDGVPVLEVEDLHKTYRLGDTELKAVAGVSFAVPPRSTLSIVGESGSGKTTVARMAARIIGSDGGTIRLAGEDVSAIRGERLREMRRRVQVVYQNPFGSLDPSFSIEKIVAEPLRAFRIGTKAHRRELVAELLGHVGLDPAVAVRRPRELSGGQRQRVAIARSLALGPELVILDEPVSALDVSVQERILQLLVDLQDEFRLSYLFISHDLGVVRQISDHVAVMQRGEIVESGEAARIFDSPQHDYTRKLLDAIPGQRAARDLP